MLIFKDLLGEDNDELFSDTYPMQTIDGILYKVKGKLTTESTDIDERAIGGNASAEGGGEDVDASSVSGIDVVLANRLVEFPVSKGVYKKHIKDYMKKVMENMAERKCSEDEVTCFKKNCSTFVASIFKEFDDYQFFVGEHMNEDGMMILVKWDEETPYLYFFKHGLEEEKV